MLDQQVLEQLRSEYQLGKVFFASSLPSTNDLASEWLQSGCPNFSLIMADQQTSGKGRSGRKWHTNPGSALALSLVITDPKLPVQLFTGLSGIAVARALDYFTTTPAQIKWPNDILINGMKVCGILTESVWSGSELTGIITGIGANIFEPSLEIEDELRHPATFLQDHAEKRLSRRDILGSILKHFIEIHNSLNERGIIAEWNARLAYKGQPIQAIRQEGESVTGTLLGVTGSGELQLRLPDSVIVEYNANEIQRIRSG